MDWFFMSAPRLAPVSGADEARSSKVGGDACAREIGPVELCALHLRSEDIRASETGSAEIGFQQPSLIEYGPVKFRVGQFGPIEPCGPQYGTGKIESGQVETRKLPAREIGRLCEVGGGNHGFDIRARHFRSRHLGRRQVDMLHHVLGRRWSCHD